MGSEMCIRDSPHTGRLTLLHVDAYRINDLDEADQLGIDDWLASGCVLLIEWAERIEQVLPQPDISIAIEHAGETARKLTISVHSKMGQDILTKLD